MDNQKRKRITKADRLQVFNKYSGRCAYCGREMEIKEMQVDHMIPLRVGGADEMWNYMPACRRCNHYKRGSSMEAFREMVEKIPQKLQRDSYIFRVGIDYGFFESNEKEVVFYFERQEAHGERQRLLPCPFCGSRAYEVDYDEYDYCPNCGQRIDWSEEDDKQGNREADKGNDEAK